MFPTFKINIINLKNINYTKRSGRASGPEKCYKKLTFVIGDGFLFASISVTKNSLYTGLANLPNPRIIMPTTKSNPIPVAN